jgi:ribosomal protein L16/L10AE
MFRIDKLKDTGRRPIKYNRFHRNVPLHVYKGTAMCPNMVGDKTGWWRLIFTNGGFIQVHQIMAAVKAVQKVVRQRYTKGDYVELGMNKTITGLSKKSAGSRMGRGKGPTVVWGFNVQAGETLVRIHFRVTKRVALDAFRYASQRLPIKLLII